MTFKILNTNKLFDKIKNIVTQHQITIIHRARTGLKSTIQFNHFYSSCITYSDNWFTIKLQRKVHLILQIRFKNTLHYLQEIRSQ